MLSIHKTHVKHREVRTTRRDNSGSKRNTRGKNKPGGTKDDDVGIIPHAPVLDKILGTQRRGRPPGVKLKNTARNPFLILSSGGK